MRGSWCFWGRIPYQRPGYWRGTKVFLLTVPSEGDRPRHKENCLSSSNHTSFLRLYDSRKKSCLLSSPETRCPCQVPDIGLHTGHTDENGKTIGQRHDGHQTSRTSDSSTVISRTRTPQMMVTMRSVQGVVYSPLGVPYRVE